MGSQKTTVKVDAPRVHAQNDKETKIRIRHGSQSNCAFVAS